MRSSRRLAGLALLLIGAGGGSLAGAAGQHDLAAVKLRVRREVTLTDQQVTTIARASLRVQNRGSQPVIFPDAATFDAAVQLSAAAAAGPIVCPPVGIARRELSTPFPITLAPNQRLRVRYELTFHCATNLGDDADWSFTAAVDRAAVDGNPDANPADDVCPHDPLGRIPSGSGTVHDRGCGRKAADGSLIAPPTNVDDRRASTRFQVSGRFAVGETAMTLVDSSRPTMPNGDYPGAPDRTLPTNVWYPSPVGVGGTDAALAPDGKPYPLIIFAHGLGSFPGQSTYLTRHLASHGYIVVAPAFPLSKLGAPGGPTLADKPAEAGDVTFLIDTFLGFSAEAGNRFQGGVDGQRVGMTGHSNGGLATLVTGYDQDVREPRIKAAVPLSPAACFFQPGYFGTLTIPLLILHGDHDLLIDVTSHAQAAFDRANAPKSIVIVENGNHLGFSDFGGGLDDLTACQCCLPPQATLQAQIDALIAALGGAPDFVSTDGCSTDFCTGDPTHIDALRQNQIGKQVALAFFEAFLRSDSAADAYLIGELAITNPDLTHQFVR